MRFKIKQTKNKEACTYKTLYIRRALLEQIERIAAEHHTSFNHVVVSMIEACLSEDDAISEEAPDTSQSASPAATPSRRSDSRSLAGPPIAPLPRNRLAFPATGGASPVSPSRGAFLFCTPSMPPLEGRCRRRRRRGGCTRSEVKQRELSVWKAPFIRLLCGPGQQAVVGVGLIGPDCVQNLGGLPAGDRRHGFGGVGENAGL